MRDQCCLMETATRQLSPRPLSLLLPLLLLRRLVMMMVRS